MNAAPLLGQFHSLLQNIKALVADANFAEDPEISIAFTGWGKGGLRGILSLSFQANLAGT